MTGIYPADLPGRLANSIGRTDLRLFGTPGRGPAGPPATRSISVRFVPVARR